MLPYPFFIEYVAFEYHQDVLKRAKRNILIAQALNPTGTSWFDRLMVALANRLISTGSHLRERYAGLATPPYPADDLLGCTTC